MKILKRLIILVLSMVMATSLFACGSNKSSGGQDSIDESGASTSDGITANGSNDASLDNELESDGKQQAIKDKNILKVCNLGLSPYIYALYHDLKAEGNIDDFYDMLEHLEFKELEDSVYEITNVYFGRYDDIEKVPNTMGIPVDIDRSGNIMMYLDNDDIYILSDDTIYFPPDSANMFNDFESVENIVFNNVDTSLVTSMKSLFYFCQNLVNLDLSNFDTSSVQDMVNMFGNCRSLSNLDLSNFDTSSVQNMEGMFSICINLAAIDLSSFNTSNVRSMKAMFLNCRSLSNLDLSNFDTNKVTQMDQMFSGCENLINLDISSFNTSNVMRMTSMFKECSRLTSLNLSNFDTSNVANVSDAFHMFEDCPAEVITGDKWTLGDPHEL